MNPFITGIQALGKIISSSTEVARALQTMRNEIPDKQWEQLCDSYPALDCLICSCIDLEASLEQ